MLEQVTRICVRVFRRYPPDPFVIVLVMTGILIQQGGLSGSIPLVFAGPGDFLKTQTSVASTARTIVSPFKLALTAVPFVMIPITKVTILPKRLAWQEALPVAPPLAVLAEVAAFDLDTVNFGLLFQALALYGSVVRPLRVSTDSVANAAGILVQFPRHAGIMGFRVLVLLSSGAMIGAAVLDF